MALEKNEIWRIHIGAHKTATTHLQDSLEFCRAFLLRNNIDYCPRQLVRSVRPWPKNGILGKKLFLFSGKIYRKFDRALDAVRQGPAQIIISEENLLGKSQHLLTPKLYPEAEERLCVFNNICSQAKLYIFISTRSYHQIFPSAYAQVLRSGVKTRGFDEIKRRMLAEPPSWADLVLRTQCILPNATISVWKFEDYCQSQQEIMSHFCGIDMPHEKSLPIPARTRSPSAQAIAKIEELRDVISKQRRKLAIETIIKNDQSRERFQPFNKEEIEFLNNQYEKDLLILNRAMPGALFHTS